MQLIRLVGLSLLLLTLTSCQQPPAQPGMKLGKPYAVDGKTYYPAYDPGYDKIGVASWYGPGFHGKYTASGEIFNQNDLTAAHPTLPMPSLVRVTNLSNGKSLIVRINDRGPFAANRIIDLSKHAAHELGVTSTAEVRVQYLKKETDEYIADAENGHMMDMAQLNADERAAPPQIVEETDASTHAGQPIDEAAPVMAVSSDNLPAHDSRAGNSGTNLADSSGHTVKTGGSIIHQAWADDTVSLPSPPADKAGDADQSQPVRLVMDDTSPRQADTYSDADPAAADAADDTPPAKPPAKIHKAVAHRAAAAVTPAVAEVASAASPATGGSYLIQAGAFSTEAHARKLSTRLDSIAHSAIDKIEAAGKTWWRVRLGPFSNREEADAALKKVRSIASDAHLIPTL